MHAAKFITLLITLTLLGGCGIPYYVSEAPGCTRWIGANIGGCSGVTAIENLKIEPAIECLTARANNCNGGMIEIWNDCEQTLVIGDLIYPPHNDLDVIQDAEGNWIPVESDGNFVRQIPAQDIQLTLAGRLGEQEVKLSFTKSAPLCGAR